MPLTQQLYYLRLPKDIKDYRVILMDATVATGAAAIMAIRVLLDHDVPEDHISLVSLLMAEIGVHSIAYAFPKVSRVCRITEMLKAKYSLTSQERRFSRNITINFTNYRTTLQTTGRHLERPINFANHRQLYELPSDFENYRPTSQTTD